MSDDTAADSLDATVDGRTAAAGSSAPRMVDRYVIVGTLGAGAMGIVYRAFDPDLGRQIALKVLRDERYQRGDGGTRFLREAQSLARLKHPNVVTIYDVGFFGDQMFISLELIDGMPLSEWVSSRPRTWRETLAMFVAAGRGLAAAHAAGLVHRDVKPDNILIGKDGVARIADFGLARLAGEPRAEEPVAGAEPAPPRSSRDRFLAAALTRTGSVLGTPRYMAPEQAAGTGSDARSDQFSFCVALYEALHGVHPFDASSARALHAAVASGAVQPPPRGTSVPAWVRAPLLTGLSAEPDRRHPSMDALLRALGRDPAPRRRRLGVAIGLAGIVVAGGLGAWRLATSADRMCTGSARLAAGSWNPARRLAVTQAFLATGSPPAAFTASEVTRRLDNYAAELAVAHHEACAATQVRHEQSAAVQELRMRCLDQRAAEQRALTGLFLHADAEVVRNAVLATRALPDIAACSDVAALAQVSAEPADLELRVRIAVLRATLAEINALKQAGKYAQAGPLAERALSDARGIGWRPLVAEAALVAGNVANYRGRYADAAAALEEALWSAEVAHADVLAARAATTLLSVTKRLGKLEDARRWERLGLAAVERADNDLVRATYEINAGALAEDDGRYDDAVAHDERAYAIRARVLGPDEVDVADALAAIASVHSTQGKAAEANRDNQRALAIYEKRLGPDHPQTAFMLSKLGTTAWDQGRFQEALDYARRALAIRERTLGPNHPLVASACNNAGIAADDLRRYDDALAYYRRALAIWTAALGPDHPDVLAVRNNIGAAYVALERWQEARAEFADVLVLKEKKLGADHTAVAEALLNLGTAELHFGRVAEAAAATERALSIITRNHEPDRRVVGGTHAQLGAIRLAQGRAADALAFASAAIGELTIAGEVDQPDLVDPLELVARLQVARGAARDAVPLLERALALHQRIEPTASKTERARFALAQALAPLDAARARALAGQARTALAAVHDPLVPAIDAWLAARR